MNIDERIEALTMNLELAMREIEALTSNVSTLQTVARQDGENIRALARIAEIHERRLTALEGDDQ
jgi:ACT domain-containing protein